MPDLNGLRHPQRTTVLLAVTLFAAGQSASAQVGLSSSTPAVALLARVPARASLQEVIPLWEKGTGSIRETSVRVRLAANRGYRLIARGAQPTGARLWVRAADGQFHELAPGARITVARHATGTEQWEQEVHYRIESEDAHQIEATTLPVRYEVAIDPVL
jgi:hypothetical protein